MRKQCGPQPASQTKSNDEKFNNVYIAVNMDSVSTMALVGSRYTTLVYMSTIPHAMIEGYVTYLAPRLVISFSPHPADKPPLMPYSQQEYPVELVSRGLVGYTKMSKRGILAHDT